MKKRQWGKNALQTSNRTFIHILTSKFKIKACNKNVPTVPTAFAFVRKIFTTRNVELRFET